MPFTFIFYSECTRIFTVPFKMKKEREEKKNRQGVEKSTTFDRREKELRMQHCAVVHYPLHRTLQISHRGILFYREVLLAFGRLVYYWFTII